MVATVMGQDSRSSARGPKIEMTSCEFEMVACEMNTQASDGDYQTLQISRYQERRKAYKYKRTE